MTITPTLTPAETAAREWDVVVVGAGPAGAMAACQLARGGAAVLLVDKSQFPRWKVCGCCLSSRAKALLKSHLPGDLLKEESAAPLKHILLAAAGNQKVRLRLDGWTALSREKLDAALVRAAIASGASFLPGAMATFGAGSSAYREILLQHGQHKYRLKSKLVVAADGLGGQLAAHESQSLPSVEKDSRIGAGIMMGSAPDFYRKGTVFMACGAGGYMGLVRVEDNRLDIAAAFDPHFVRTAGGPAQAGASLLKEMHWPMIPGIGEQRWRGTVRLTRRAPALGSERVLVLGDAAGYIEPFTGEGITWALTAAVAVTPLAQQAIQRWHPSLISDWSKLHHAVIVRRQFACRIFAKVLRHPSLVRSMLTLVKCVPELGTPVVRYIGAFS